MIKKLSSKKAFTIIEVVLVLGIAGLIILAVFVAVPALQRSKRNQVRKDDMTRIMQAVVSWQSSHSGKAPTYFLAGSKDNLGNTPGNCVNLETALNANEKSCFRINTDFVTKNIDSNAVFDPDLNGGDNPWQYTGWEFYYKCEQECTDFMDPDGTIYVLKVEGPGFAGNEKMFNFDHRVHISPYGRCSTMQTSDANGATQRTKDANDITITYRLEGSQAIFCIDNQ